MMKKYVQECLRIVAALAVFGLVLIGLAFILLPIPGCGGGIDRPSPLGNIESTGSMEPPTPTKHIATTSSSLTGDNGQNGMLVAYGGAVDVNGQNYCYCVPGGNYFEGAIVDVEACSDGQANNSPCSSWTVVGWNTPGYTAPQYIQSNMLTGQWYLDARNTCIRRFCSVKPILSRSPQNPLWTVGRGQLFNDGIGQCLGAGRNSVGPSATPDFEGSGGLCASNLRNLVKGDRFQTAIRFDGWTDPATGHVMYVCPTSTIKGSPIVLCDGAGQDVNGVDDPPVSAQWINFTDTFYVNNGPTIATLGTRYSIPGSDHTLFLEGFTGTIGEADNYDALYFTSSAVGTTPQVATLVTNGGSQWCLTVPFGAGAGATVTPTRCGDGSLATQQFSEVYEF